MTESARRRKLWIIALGACLLTLFLVLGAMNAFKNFLSPQTESEVAIYTGLATLAFLLFVIILVLLVRNVLKLYSGQSNRLMGHRLRTRMLWGAVLVSLIPISFMFAFSYGLMNRAVDRWFSQPVTEMRDDSTRIAVELSQYTAANARVEAGSIAAELPSAAEVARSRETLARAADLLHRHEITLQGGFAAVYRDTHALAAFHLPHRPSTAPQVKPWLPDRAETADDTGAARAVSPASGNEAVALNTPLDGAILAAARRTDQPIFTIGPTDFALGTAILKDGGTVVVGLPMPYGMSATMDRLRKAADDYWRLFRSRRLIRNTYMWLLAMMTSLALFATSWLALHLAKQVTQPVEALADAMEAIAAGDYAHRVSESATVELEELVRSFNHMAADLEGSRHAVDQYTIELSRANAALEARRGELETMLQTIPNGVATLSPERRILLANRALSEMMDPGGQKPFLSLTMQDVFPHDAMETLDRLLRRSHRMGTASGDLEMPRQGLHAKGTLNLLATVALLEAADRTHLGYVLVLEDATELLQAQKQSAWKEVARRVAHEIKNPLTPIALSAEQIHRHTGRLEAAGVESPSIATIRRSSEVISSSVESMRGLVDQFSALAEFPTAKPRPADLNTIVENSVALFAGRLDSIRLVRRLAPNLPLVMADPEALKRALGNLIDNAAEAMQGSLLRELRITTTLLDTGLAERRMELTIADTGPGLTPEMRERLFLPYFSTKQRGTGLGLAIASKIIQEHDGTIRAEENEPTGAKFILELRPASVSETIEPSAETSILLPVGRA